ncbi:cyclase family protein [Actinokineospora sp. UTMC 2448]|uniref:cyclase family protein n=1 Tax=Actinokineospora sp. UTMC 2448 TaxID=2268449 RepID=UPI0021645D63|nr:cyclase family protein [Actinokineospora sp. UTMC 2448]UVS79293.1 Kynurenine formamidase [Actinokineospora sp. UTMC 2448]
MNTRVIDLSHPVEHNMVTYPGLPGPVIGDHLSRADSRGRYAEGTEFQIGTVTMLSNTGTYLDAPFHRFPDGADLAALDLSRLVDLDGVVVDATDRAVGPEAFADLDVTGRAVIVRTGWDRHWRTPEYGGAQAPFVTAAAAEWLVERQPALVGIDSVNIDDLADLSRPTHTALLAAGIPIIEHLRGLDRLSPAGFRFHAAPVGVVGMGTFPVRAYAIVDGV